MSEALNNEYDSIESQDDAAKTKSAAPPAATSTAAAVVDCVFERDGRKARVENERQHPRKRWVAKITIWLRKDRLDIPREVRVKTQDISQGGFSFLHPRFLHSETLVTTRFDTLPGCPIVTGVIKSCVYIGDALHRVGVEFIANSADE
jgi:hypothetical protein